MNKILHGDCLEKLKELEDNSVDSIVTDPPYELGFMGKKWDSTGIANNVELWKECLRVLKPGGHLLAFSGTRTYHRMVSAIEDAGFEVRDMIEWVYGSGFPKSLDISKSLDKRRVKNFDEVRTFLRGEIKKSGLTHNQLLEKLGLAIGSGLITHWTTENKESYQILPSPAQWQNLKKVLNFSSEFDSDIISYEREVVGKRKSLALPISQELKGWGEKQEYDITIPATAEAKQWEGWGTALKPAHEPICMARKPLAEKTVAENCLKWKCGGLNIDVSRVGIREKEQFTGKKEGSINTYGDYFYEKSTEPLPAGRFPANLIHDNSEEVRECFPETKNKGHFPKNNKNGDSIFNTNNLEQKEQWLNDSGNASRFFKSIIYQSKAPRSERLLDGFDCAKIEVWKNKDENMEVAVSLVRAILDLMAENLNTVESGGNITVIYPKDSISTIRTTIKKITELKTWNSLMHSPTKDFIVDVFSKKMDGGNLVGYAENSNELMTKIGIFQEKVGLATEDVKNAIYQELLKISEQNAWKEASSHHPTHKPIALMEYLIKMVTPRGGIVLDPFAGSGSTLIAAKQNDFQYIGIEMEEEYVKIAEARLSQK